jgi:hypothetical protein
VWNRNLPALLLSSGLIGLALLLGWSVAEAAPLPLNQGSTRPDGDIDDYPTKRASIEPQIETVFFDGIEACYTAECRAIEERQWAGQSHVSFRVEWSGIVL